MDKEIIEMLKKHYSELFSNQYEIPMSLLVAYEKVFNDFEIEYEKCLFSHTKVY